MSYPFHRRWRLLSCAIRVVQTAVRGLLHRDPPGALRKALEHPPIFCKDEAVKVIEGTESVKYVYRSVLCCVLVVRLPLLQALPFAAN